MNLLTNIRPQSRESYLTTNPLIISLFEKKERGEVLPPLLFEGSSGMGKTTLARILASNTTLFEKDCGTLRGIDEARQLIESNQTQPLFTDKVTIILDECHNLTDPAKESLLKFIEEPPPWVQIILCTTNVSKLKPTLVKRCYKISFNSFTQIRELVSQACEKLNKPEKTDEYCSKIIACNISAPRDILNACQILNDGGSISGTTTSHEMFEAVQLLFRGQAIPTLKILESLDNQSIINFRFVVANYGKAILIKGQTLQPNVLKIYKNLLQPLPEPEVLQVAAIILAVSGL